MPRFACLAHAREVPRRVALLTLLLTATGCSETSKPARTEPDQRAAPAHDKLTTNTTQGAAQPAKRAAGQLLKLSPSPLGTHTAEVTANGSGCPADSWKADASSDGKTITVSFPAYAAEVDKKRGVSVKDCQIALQLRGERPLSYALAALSLEGEAELTEGSDAKLMASHYQQGSPGSDEGAQKELRGPSKAAFVLDQSIADDRKAWSKCDVQRDLNVSTRVRVKTASADGEGRVRPTKLVLALAERACDTK